MLAVLLLLCVKILRTYAILRVWFCDCFGRQMLQIMLAFLCPNGAISSWTRLRVGCQWTLLDWDPPLKVYNLKSCFARCEWWLTGGCVCSVEAFSLPTVWLLQMPELALVVFFLFCRGFGKFFSASCISNSFPSHPFTFQYFRILLDWICKNITCLFMPFYFTCYFNIIHFCFYRQSGCPAKSSEEAKVHESI